jgi:GxxExxY protein
MADNHVNASGLGRALTQSVATETATKRLTERIIGCAIEVHRQLGPGLLEGTYEAAMCIELAAAGLNYVKQPIFPVVYKEQVIGEYRLDLIVEDTIVIEIKSVERFDPIFEAQVLTYLKVTGKSVGLLINFNSRLVKDGIRRFIFDHSNAL